MRTAATGVVIEPRAGKLSRQSESLNRVSAELEAYVRALKGHQLYCDTARRFQRQRLTRDSVFLTVWEIAGPSSVLNHRKLCLALRASTIPVRWYRFPAGPIHERFEEKIGKVEVTTFDTQFPLPGGSAPLSVVQMESIKARFGTGWPDIIISDHFLSDFGLQNKALDAALNNVFHFVEPGGILVTVETALPPLSKFMEENRGTGASVASDDVWTWYNERNIYEGRRGSVADRTKIFDTQTCQDAVVRTIDRLDLDNEARVLDVGTGDGRFSEYIFDKCNDKGWTYKGLEMSGDPHMRPPRGKLQDAILNANFFCTEWNDDHKACSEDIVSVNSVGPRHPGRKKSRSSAATHDYSAIFLFFVLHAVKFWQFFIFRAYELLKPGGYLVLSFRDDNFCNWLHGIFDDSTKSPVKNSMQGYWDARLRSGVRNSEQMYNVISPVESIRFAEKLGFRVEEKEMVRVSNEREYQVLRQHFCPGEQGAAYWNIARVGVTRSDDRNLRESFQPESVNDTLRETMIVFILKKT